jgi:hypothetical protein
MTQIQLARLQNDTAELKSYIEKIRSKNPKLVSKLEKKLEYLQTRIAERMAA